MCQHLSWKKDVDQAGKMKQKAGQRLIQGGYGSGVGDTGKDKWGKVLLETFWEEQLVGERQLG